MDSLDGDGELWSAWFVVDQQSFRIGVDCDRDSAVWLCWQFAKAMKKVMSTNQPGCSEQPG